jgi:predicted GH43/DUF377 family glycosyl hydrolase
MQNDTFGILLEPCHNEFESYAVLNSTAYQDGQHVHLLYRAVRKPNYSSIGYALMKGPTSVVDRKSFPVIFPEHSFECEGCEDPRVTKIDDDFYILYTAWDGRNPRIAVAKSKDLRSFEKIGIVSPNISVAEAMNIVDIVRYKTAWNRQAANRRYDSILGDKDAVLFPRKFGGKYAMLHRLEPDIQIVYFDDFSDLTSREFWEDYLSNLESHVVMRQRYEWEDEKIGAGAVPIETDEGWLLIYHGVHISQDMGRVYRAGASLLNLHDPQIEVARLKQPIFEPRNHWEMNGVVNNVVFPEGASIFGDDLYVYYGAADSIVAWRKFSLHHLLSMMKIDL